uniref:Uncharacterized protein n=1 Tax=Noccaea caerulescens TaxID=107243 RepID=A0A1J3ENS9_NOCCA
MAAAGEKRIVLFPKSSPAQAKPRAMASPITVFDKDSEVVKIGKELGSGDGDGSSGKELTPEESMRTRKVYLHNRLIKA